MAKHWQQESYDIINIIISFLVRFSCQHLLVVFHRSLGDSKSPPVSRTLLSIIANLHDAVVCMILILPLIVNYFCLFSKLLGTFQITLTIVGITITFTFRCFYQFSGRVQVFIYLFAFFYHHSAVCGGFDLLHNSLRIIFSTHLYLVLYSFCASLLHSLIMWLIISSLSPNTPHLLFSGVLSTFALIRLVFTTVFCPAIIRDSISLLKPCPGFLMYNLSTLSLDIYIYRLTFFPFLFGSFYCFSVYIGIIIIIIILLFSEFSHQH